MTGDDAFKGLEQVRVGSVAGRSHSRTKATIAMTKGEGAL